MSGTDYGRMRKVRRRLPRYARRFGTFTFVQNPFVLPVIIFSKGYARRPRGNWAAYRKVLHSGPIRGNLVQAYFACGQSKDATEASFSTWWPIGDGP